MVGRCRVLPSRRWSSAPADQFGDALLHFAGGLVGEGDGEDVSGRDALRDEVGDAEGDDAGFARAGAGQNQNRAVQRFDGLALLGIE